MAQSSHRFIASSVGGDAYIAPIPFAEDDAPAIPSVGGDAHIAPTPFAEDDAPAIPSVGGDAYIAPFFIAIIV